MDNQKFRDLLDSSYQWPDYYEFKFIVKTEDKGLVIAKLTGLHIHESPSKQGNYTSISARKLIQSTEEVIEVYKSVGSIPGVISL